MKEYYKSILKNSMSVYNENNSEIDQLKRSIEYQQAKYNNEMNYYVKQQIAQLIESLQEKYFNALMEASSPRSPASSVSSNNYMVQSSVYSPYARVEYGPCSASVIGINWSTCSSFYRE